MRAHILIPVVALALLGEAPHPIEPWPDWDRAQRDATTALMQPGEVLAGLVRRVRKARPKSGQEAMFALSVLGRAGVDGESTRLLRYLKKSCQPPQHAQVMTIYANACRKYEAWELAQAVLELFADRVGDSYASPYQIGSLSRPSLLERGLLKHFEETGWSFEKVDRWLAARPDGINYFWVRERLRFQAQHGRGKELAENMAARIRAHPDDVSLCLGFLTALVEAGRGLDDRPKLDWLAGTVQTEALADSFGIAARLQALGEWDAAATFYRRAMDTQASDAELRSLILEQVPLSPADQRANSDAYIRDRLVTCLRKMGRNEEAEKYAAEAAELWKRSREMQQSHRRVRESSETQQLAGTEDCRYWQELARKHGRDGETTQQEQALIKAWSLAPPSARGDVGKFPDRRALILSDHARFLIGQKRRNEALALVRKEIAESPADSIASAEAVTLLATWRRSPPGPAKESADQFRADVPLLWGWLERRETWGYTARLQLKDMFSATDPADAFLARAEKLAKGTNPTRALALGMVETELGYRNLAVPLLVDAMARSQNDMLRDEAARTLFRTYLEEGDWKKAEGVFPAWAPNMAKPKQYARVAVAAAKAGAKVDAMRIWKRLANIDLTETDALRQLAEAGLRNELITFYRDMQTQLPRSRIPAQALAQLGVRAAE